MRLQQAVADLDKLSPDEIGSEKAEQRQRDENDDQAEAREY